MHYEIHVKRHLAVSDRKGCKGCSKEEFVSKDKGKAVGEDQ